MIQRVLFFILCLFFLQTSLSLAATTTGSTIVVTNVSSNETTITPNTVFTITGQNLPIYINSSGQPSSFGGYTFNNFQMGETAAWEVGYGADWGINVLSSTSTEMQFDIPAGTYGSSNNIYNLYMAPTGTNLSSASSNAFFMGQMNLTTGTFVTSISQAPAVTITNATLASVTLSWNSVSDATSYNVYENGSSTALQSGITGTSTMISGLNSGTTYTFQVAGVNSIGPGPLSAVLNVSTESLVPPLLTATPTNTGSINLSWKAAAGAVSYDVYVNGKVDVSSVTHTNYILSNLPLNTPVSIVVYSIDANGNRSLPSVTQNVTPAIPGPQLTYSNLTNKSITLTWKAVAGATSYQVYENDPVLVVTTSATSTTINNLTSGQPYSFTVNAVTSNGNSLSSSPVSISVPTMYFGFTATDVLMNALSLIASLVGLLLLALVVEFSPRLMDLLFRAPASKREETTEYDPEWATSQASATKEISPISFDE